MTHALTPTAAPATTPPPPWLDVAAYPFGARWLDTPDGRLHYVDEGAGPAVVLVHGTPTWSFVWRDLIGRLARAGYRAIAVDHLGFGLSDKPPSGAYRPADHARRLAALLDALDVCDATLVVHDFGGPIGLACALDRPARIARHVLLNTWLWALDADPRIARGGRLAGSALGGFLYRRLNASPRWLLPAAFADRRRLTPGLHQQYLAPFPDAASRAAPHALARALLGASRWYDALWARRDALAQRPALLVWGLRDPAFGPAYLARWREALPQAEVVEIADAGHFVQEEAPEMLAEQVLRFLARHARA